MKISARTRYGLRILLDIAQHEQNESPRTIGAIAASQDISAAFISRLAVPLKRAHLIRAERGVGGGLRLARPPEDITILDIAEFRAGDHIAEIGLSALIVGGAAAAAVKTGAFKWIGKGLVVLVAAIGGLFRKIFGKGKRDQ